MKFFKFPKTPHLFVQPGIYIRKDKIMTKGEAIDFLENEIVIEEKVDGTNVGISLDTSNQLQIQNRGNFIDPDSHPQFDTIFDWVWARARLFTEVLTKKYILFGEWCYLKHSIHYTSLPDWFLGFDVYDRDEHKFLSTKKRNEIFKFTQVKSVPLIKNIQTSKKELLALLDIQSSALSTGHLEGLYLRIENDEWLMKRAKLVRREFLHEIREHWTRKVMTKNQLQFQPNRITE